MENELIAFARELIAECGKKLTLKRKKEMLKVEEKDGCSDIVTNHDRWAQKYIITRIVKQYPKHIFLGEEGIENSVNDCSWVNKTGIEESLYLYAEKNDDTTSEDIAWTWVIDPIDGTSNYACLGRDYAISVALFKNGYLYYGWVYDVEEDIMYEGKNHYEIATEDHYMPQECLLYMGHKTMRDLEYMGVNPYHLCQNFRGVRYEGCASLEICKIISWKNRVYLNSHLKIWDFAAAVAILSSHACKVNAVLTEQGKYMVCAYSSEQVYSKCEEYIAEGMKTVLENRERKVV
ncbi:inositol monophosphatase family protein [Anaerosporobacter sp.]|uniref:inositol monophosphatase family protein n=1 Tax=Anaerosporobacter sp. TaxID=1872529 RepID=UPI00286F4252|nr:inositol monophosphatase family protein [Anaerosporobacter sp.]